MFFKGFHSRVVSIIVFISYIGLDFTLLYLINLLFSIYFGDMTAFYFTDCECVLYQILYGS